MSLQTTAGKHSEKTNQPGSEAVANTWLGLTIVQATALAGMFVALMIACAHIFSLWDESFKPFFDEHPVSAPLIVLALLLFPLGYIIVPRSLRHYREKQRNSITLVENPKAESTRYFRLDPYVPFTPQEFRREDDAHKDVLKWVRESKHSVLFLSGVSGSGKSSVLEAYVLPMLQAEGWRIEQVRSFENPTPQLESALAAHRPEDARLLIVLDQFEEFVILEDRTSNEERRRFMARIRELQQNPPLGICLLFSFRRDYMSDVIAMRFVSLVPGQTFIEIDAFRRDAARRFLEGGPKKPPNDLINRLLAGAEALDDVPARFRPITLNMLGLALQEFDPIVTSQPERLVQGYMEKAIAQPEIREIAPLVIEKMITDANTKDPAWWPN